MTSASLPTPWRTTHREWKTIVFLGAIHALAVAGIVYLVLDFSWWTLALGVGWYFLAGLSITAGYHRLFAHRSYRASWPVRTLLLAFGAAAFQRSAIEWCINHRDHHRYTDQEADPYSVRHGFWWAHFGWVISNPQVERERTRVPRDLEADPLIRLQHRYWLPLALVMGLALPATLGLIWGDPLGGFLVAGCLRIALTWHSTWAVNSFAHRFGRRPYALDESARDSFWVALLSLGEGHHNFHHRFQSDYRNGVRWYQYDPTKWMIGTLARLGLVRDLTRVPRETIARVRLAVKSKTATG